MTINTLEDDILLGVFNSCRLANEDAWNNRIGWQKLSHVCRRWRHLIYQSAFHLGIHILCTEGAPVVTALDHLPPRLPLIIDYQCEGNSFAPVDVRRNDALGLYQALRLHDRVRHIELHLQPSTLHIPIILMDKPFPILEHLSLLVVHDGITTLTLLTTFLAPNLRRLTLSGICLPKRLRLLTSTVSLSTLALLDIPASGYFRPRLLMARLQSLPQLEELSIGFSVPIPRPSAERELLGKQGTPVTLLKIFEYQGVSAYLERLISQMRAPLLDQLQITLFNQIAFTLPHLTYFVNRAEQIKLHAVMVSFQRYGVSIASDFSYASWDKPFVLRVRCKPLDWQIDCMEQICSAFTPILSGVDKLTLHFEQIEMPTEWQVDGTTWQQLLRSFFGVEELLIDYELAKELSRALDVNEIGSDPGFLPGLQRITYNVKLSEDRLFDSFIQARQLAGRPISVTREHPLSRGLFGPRSPISS